MGMNLLEIRSRTDLSRMCSGLRYPAVFLIAPSMRGWSRKVRHVGRARRFGVALADQSRSVDFIARHALFGAQATQAAVFEALAKLAVSVEPSGHCR